MCQIQSDIERTVDGLVANGKPFTAYNVTQILRNLSINGSHREIRRVVHKMFDTGRMGSFLQELVTLPLPNPANANLYYPPGVDPKDQNLLQEILSGPNAQAQTTTAPASASASNSAAPAVVIKIQPPVIAPGSKGISRTIKRNSTTSYTKAVGTKPGSCLYIPKSMAAALNIPANGPAYVSLDPAQNKISIMPHAIGTAKKACVDRNSNIRIGKSALLSVGINGQIKVEMDGQAIQISKG